MSQDLALLFVRIVIGALLVGHGSQKLFGWFGGFGFAGTRGFMGSVLRLRPATFWTGTAIASELGGGLLFASGLLSPFGGLAIVAAMTMAAITAHWPKLWIQDNGLEYVLVLGVVAASVGLAGPGAYSLDNAFGIDLPAPATFLVGLAAVAAGIVTALATRTPLAKTSEERPAVVTDGAQAA